MQVQRCDETRRQKAGTNTTKIPRCAHGGGTAVLVLWVAFGNIRAACSILLVAAGRADDPIRGNSTVRRDVRCANSRANRDIL